MCIQMILIAESNRLQQILATYGIRTQTPVEIEPLKVCESPFSFHFLS